MPRTCFSQAQAERSVSSRGRSAFQPSSLLARCVSAQTAFTSPAVADDLVVERQPVRPFEALHQFQDRDRRARADIENLVGLLHPPLRHAVDRGYMGFGQVDDVDVVTQAGAVGRVVVVAEDRKAFAQSRRPSG